MQLTIEAKGSHAGDVSYFIGKHPDNPFTKKTKFGKVEFKFLHYEKEYIKAYLSFQADGLSMVKDSEYFKLDQYINDREFSVSTIFLSNIRDTIGYTLSGISDGHKHQINEPLDFTLEVSPFATTLPLNVLYELFEPLGYEVELTNIEDTYNFSLKTANVVSLTLKNHVSIVSLFRHLFTLVPVIDNYTHHFVDKHDADKLLRYGEGWLETHPLRQFITKRFVRYKMGLANEVLHQLEKTESENEDKPEKKVRLGEIRYQTFVEELKKLPITEVVDMGAGEGNLLELVAQDKQFQQIYACEPTKNGIARMRKRMDALEKKGRLVNKPDILQSSLFYRDERLKNKEAIVLCEVIEHIDRNRIDGVMNTLLGYYQPTHFLMSTPNVEYNVLYDINTPFRHNDHRFEMTRKEFEDFSQQHANAHGYSVTFKGIGDGHEEYGHPTQLALFTRQG